MQRLTPLLSIVILASFLTGCAARASAQSEEIKTVENDNTPRNLPEKSQPTDSVQPEDLLQEPPASCPITVAPDPAFVPPEPYSPTSPFPGEFWYGTNSLWTLLPAGGLWADLPHSSQGYGQKVFWWREGYIWNEEPQPQISVTAERLDAPATPFKGSIGTNAYASDIGSAMLTGVNFSTEGCWKVTGKYEDAELNFVVWVAP